MIERDRDDVRVRGQVCMYVMYVSESLLVVCVFRCVWVGGCGCAGMLCVRFSLPMSSMSSLFPVYGVYSFGRHPNPQYK